MTRWLYPDENDRAEAADRARVTRAMNAWWQAFARHAGDIAAHFSRANSFDLVGFMRTHLDAVDDGLNWEFGPAVGGKGHCLCITPEGRRYLQPMIAALLARAPSLTGWEFYPHRLADSVENALSIASQVSRFEPDGPLLARAALNEANRVDLTFDVPRPSGADENAVLHFMLKVAEHVLGEQVLDKWVGAIEAAPQAGKVARLLARGPGRGMVPIDRLKPTVDAVIAAAREQQPPEPRHRRHPEVTGKGMWTSYTLEARAPGGDGDYPQFDDQIFLMTWDPPLALACRSRGFASERFTRSNETFAYLKLDHAAVPREDLAAWRGDLEEALNARLAADGVGSATGGGAGLRYAYIDLALADVDRAIPVLQDAVARHPQASPRSWLLFFDPELAREWIGLHADTPAPPIESSPDGN